MPDSSQTYWLQIAVFALTAFVALVTVTATVINYLFFRSQTEPDVIVYVTPDERRPSFILLVIHNVGKGLARRVSFTTAEPLPEEAFGFDDAPMPAPMKSGPIITGIPSLGPGAKRVITWGQFGGLQKGLDSKVIDVEVRFESKRSLLPGYKVHKQVCPVEVISFEGTDCSDYNWDKKLYEEVKKITSTLHRMSTARGLQENS